MAEVLHFHLLEFTSSEEKLARRDLVPKWFSNLETKRVKEDSVSICSTCYRPHHATHTTSYICSRKMNTTTWNIAISQAQTRTTCTCATPNGSFGCGHVDCTRFLKFVYTPCAVSGRKNTLFPWGTTVETVLGGTHKLGSEITSRNTIEMGREEGRGGGGGEGANPGKPH
jgi:hypothetical protein